MAVIGLASAVAGFVKIRHLVDKAVIDNAIFRMHYRVTSAILFLSCVIVTANNLIGDPISCIGDGAIDRHVINTYCWITYTFTMPSHRNKPIGQYQKIEEIRKNLIDCKQKKNQIEFECLCHSSAAIRYMK